VQPCGNLTAPAISRESRSRAYFQRIEAIAKLKVMDGMTVAEARAFLRDKVAHYRDKTRPWELCLAMNRRGLPCQALALDNGRCRNHGGMIHWPQDRGRKAPFPCWPQSSFAE
jgi:hypothetical protein